MMKKIHLLLGLSLLSSTIQARQISESEARAIAAGKLPGLEKEIARVKAKGLSASPTYAPVYLFNSPDKGFAIVAGDDRMPNMLLAYSDNGTLDMDNCPPAMLAWLQDMQTFISAGNFSKAQRADLDYSHPVSPMISTKWGQMEPYNLLTPVIPGSGHCPTGCPATAIAQILNYWEYPRNGGLCEHSYTWNGQTLSVDFRESRYDWENMADTYTKSLDLTDPKNMAVAKLMYDCGVSCDMVYGPEQSGSSVFACAWGLVDMIGVSRAVRIRLRDYMSDDEWFALVKSELDQGRPLLYIGATVNDEGHAFVCDGYDANGLFHINWGWDGTSDGYYDLDTLHPDIQGTGGAASGYAFTVMQTILTGIQPPHDTDIPAKGWEMTVTSYFNIPNDTEGETFDIGIVFTNLGYRPFSGDLLAYISRKDGDEKLGPVLLAHYGDEEPIATNEGTQLTIPDMKASDFEDGTWMVDVVARSSATGQDDEVSLCKMNDVTTAFEIKNGRLVYDPRPKINVEQLKVDPIEFFTTLDDGTRVRFANISFSLSNNSGITLETGINVNVKFTGDGSQQPMTATFDMPDSEPLEPGDAAELELPIYFSINTQVDIEIGDGGNTGDEGSQAVFIDNTMSFILRDIYRELAFSGDPTASCSADKVTITAPVKSVTGAAGIEPDYLATTEREVTCAIYDVETDGIVTTATATYSGVWGQAQDLVFQPQTALGNGDYLARFIYTAAPGPSNDAIMYLGEEDGFEGLEFSIEDSGIADIPADNNNKVEIYNLQGVRVDADRGLIPGVYIRRQDGACTKIHVR